MPNWAAIDRLDFQAVPRQLISGAELDRPTLEAILARAAALKREPLSSRALAGQAVALLFERPSTRTRISFEVGIFELGGHPAVLRGEELQLSRGESWKDTALVLSRQVAAIGARTASDRALAELAESASVPVFNMLTPSHHPCQALADLLTVREALGRLEGVKVAYVGAATNVARSLALLGGLAGMEVAIASPPGYGLDPGEREALHNPRLFEDPLEAVGGAQVLYTDVWVSMGEEAERERREQALAPYRLDERLLEAAAPQAFVLHCLPAHPGKEISPSLLYGPRQRIWEQAENRRHAQKALLEWLVGKLP